MSESDSGFLDLYSRPDSRWSQIDLTRQPLTIYEMTEGQLKALEYRYMRCVCPR